ncbi:hypothetical protein D3C87_2183930 [compost metagenome]
MQIAEKALAANLLQADNGMIVVTPLPPLPAGPHTLTLQVDGYPAGARSFTVLAP